MEYKESLLSSIYALKMNKLRTFLTMLGIIIGISSVILIISIGQGAVAFVTNELSQLGTNVFTINPGSNIMSATAGSANTLTMDDVDAIKEDTSISSNIELISINSMGTVKASANGIDKSVMTVGASSEVYNIFNPDMIHGEFYQEEDDLSSERVAVLGIDVIETFFGEDANPVGETIKLNNMPFRIVGVAESSSFLAGGMLNKSIYIPVSVMFDQILGEEYVQEIAITVKDTEMMNQTMEDIEILLRDKHNLEEDEESDFIIQSFQDTLAMVETITNLLTIMVAAISAISLVVGGVGVMNIMFVSVTERTKEIGLLKAIGAKENDILKQFLIEAIVMTSLGGIVGITIGVAASFLISVVIGIPFVVNPIAVLLAVGVSMGVGIIFGIYPAKKAARLSPIDALRYE